MHSFGYQPQPDTLSASEGRVSSPNESSSNLTSQPKQGYNITDSRKLLALHSNHSAHG